MYTIGLEWSIETGGYRDEVDMVQILDPDGVEVCSVCKDEADALLAHLNR